MKVVEAGQHEINRRSFLAGAAGVGAIAAIGVSPLAHAMAPEDGPVATTEYGKIRGISSLKVLSFRGVPYGGPTDGANRFMPPTKPAPWKGVRDTTKAGPKAMQTTGDVMIGDKNIFSSPLIGFYFSGGRTDAPEITAESQSENCLVLNVMTPALKGKRPVMVYMHGGGFAEGTGALTLLADRLVAENDIVIVGINHRLNAFGYTYLGDIDPKFEDSGNAGQLDLIQALQWVKANIANFGGDRNNVTIFGESGGGGKVSAVMAMPMAKGLFHRAIIQSGSSRSVGTKEAATEAAKKMMESLGVKTVEELQKVPADKLLAAARRNGPVMDGRSIPHQTWKPTAPPEAAGIALLVGNCKDEQTLFSTARPELWKLTWETLADELVKIKIPADKAKEIIQVYHTQYPKDSASDVYFRLSSDRGARTNAIAQAESKVEQASGDVYMYNFAWDTPVGDGRLKAFHTSDLPLEMRLVAYPESEELSKQLGGAWASFARSGDPNHSGLPHWEKYTAVKKATMVFDVGNTALIDAPNHEELALLEPYASGTL
jgi:para-nitrobenzyl esterase